jgi:hypothetical protein
MPDILTSSKKKNDQKENFELTQPLLNSPDVTPTTSKESLSEMSSSENSPRLLPADAAAGEEVSELDDIESDCQQHAISPMHADRALSDENVVSVINVDLQRTDSLVPREDVFEEMVITIASLFAPPPSEDQINNKKKCQQKMLQYSTKGFFQLFYMAAAVQPAFNSGAAARGLLGEPCVASDPLSFLKVDAGLIFVASVMICAWYANYRTMLEYLPVTLEKMWDMFVKRDFTYLRAGAFLLGVAGGIVAFQLNVEAMAGFMSSGVSGKIFATFVIASGVSSMFSSRFMGSDIMLSIIYERLLSCLYIDWIYDRLGNLEKATFYKTRRQLLIALSDIYTYEYLIPKVILEDFCNRITDHGNDSQYAAFSLLFNANDSAQWPGLLEAIKPSYWGKLGYYFCLVILACVCCASYPISYYITDAAFPWLPGWGDISYVAASPNTFFYVYSLLFVVDQVARSFTLSQGFSGRAAIARWLGFGIAMFVGVLSCLNLVYTASSQSDKGNVNFILLLFMVYTRYLSMVDGGLISGLCNVLPILKIDEKYANEKHFERSQKMLTDIDKFICSNKIESQISVADLVSQQHEAYQAPFFPSFFKDEREEQGVIYNPLINNNP